MIFKSYLLEQNIKSLDDYKIFLFYGENEGLKKEFKEKIKKTHKDTEILNFLQEEIIKDKDLLINEIESESLFVKKKTIFIEQTNDKILDIFEEIIEKIKNEKIFIFANILDKKSKLRSYFEKSKICGISACYQDNEITIKKIITSKLVGFQGLTPQVINLIIQSSGLDRNKINNEIEKIISCFRDKKIDLTKIDQLLNIKTNDDFNELKDEALSGNLAKTNRLLADTVFETENNFYYLNSINQRINRLCKIDEMKTDLSNIESLITSLKPPVFWKDKPTLIEQSKKWNKKKLQAALEKTYNTELEIKSNSSIRKDLLIKNLIIELCTTANSA